MLNLGVLVSGSGTNLQALIDAVSEKRLSAALRVVVSNKPGVMALERATLAGIPTRVLSHRDAPSREAFDAQIVAALREFHVDAVVLAGFMRIVTPVLLDAFRDRVINIHPSLLPAFPGVDSQAQAFHAGVRITGCTVHFVDQGTDTGAIIAQAAVPIIDGDDVESLRARILAMEHRLLPAALQWLSEGRIHREGRHVRIDGATAAFAVACPDVSGARA